MRFAYDLKDISSNLSPTANMSVSFDKFLELLKKLKMWNGGLEHVKNTWRYPENGKRDSVRYKVWVTWMKNVTSPES